MEGGLHPQTMELDKRARREGIGDRESPPGQKVGTPSKEEAGPRDTPFHLP